MGKSLVFFPTLVTPTAYSDAICLVAVRLAAWFIQLDKPQSSAGNSHESGYHFH